MTTYQYMLVQCPHCKSWFIVRGRAGKFLGVGLNDLVDAELAIMNECGVTNHRGRRRWRTTASDK